MGSLMAGWNSPVLNKKRGVERSSSFTKEEIEEFWNKHKLAHQEHLQAASALAIELKLAQQDTTSKVDGSGNQENEEGAGGKGASSVEESSLVVEELERPHSFNDWWTKSNWAFLNVPAMRRMEAANYKYTSQFHVATKSASAPSSPRVK